MSIVSRRGSPEPVRAQPLRQQRTRLKLRGFVYFSWRDGRPYAPRFKNLWGLHTGLLTVKGKRKPAYNAFVGAVRPLTR